jgi:hypothetical protein
MFSSHLLRFWLITSLSLQPSLGRDPYFCGDIGRLLPHTEYEYSTIPSMPPEYESRTTLTIGRDYARHTYGDVKALEVDAGYRIGPVEHLNRGTWYTLESLSGFTLITIRYGKEGASVRLEGPKPPTMRVCLDKFGVHTVEVP